MRAYASSEMANYVEKLQRIIYDLQTEVISKLILFVKLTDRPFLRGQYFEILYCFRFLERTVYLLVK